MGLFHRVVVVDIDRCDLRTAFLAGARGMGHHVDLGIYRVGAPDHNEIGYPHLARVDASDLAGADGKSDARDGRTDGAVETGILLHMREAIDAVAHNEPHGAGVVIGPDRLRAEFALGLVEARGDLIERIIPGNPRELAGAFGSGAAHWM